MQKILLATCLLAVAIIGAVAATEDFTQRWNYVDPAIIGDEQAEKALFGVWAEKLNKFYPSVKEESLRYSLFRMSLRRVVEKNSKLPAGKLNYGINKFSDMDPAEWADKYLAKKIHTQRKKMLLENAKCRMPKTDAPLPAAGIDWRDLNAVTFVKDQGQCGSCWAFSVVETVESQVAIKANSSALDLSPQQIVDCDWGDGDQGCNGGDPAVAYVYVKKNGLMTDDAYPYFSGDSGVNGTCEYDATKVAARISGFTYATPPCSNGTCANQNDVLLAQNIFQHGPAGIIVDASNWQDYTFGSFSDCASDYASMDHGVQVVGFIRDSSPAGLVDEWIVRNSWGEDWGDFGYIQLAGSTFENNTCGISNEAIYADL